MSYIRDGSVLACMAAIVYGLAQWNAGLAWVGGGLIGVVLLVIVEKEVGRRRKP